jgi:predicted nuclease of restriction endonuclease-like (RecB) superfamily
MDHCYIFERKLVSMVQAVLAPLPWYHQLALLDKLKTAEERQWYAAQALENGWSRNVLVIQIESGLRQRTGKAITNFSQRLPQPQSDLARESLKDPYRLDFLGLGKEAQERAIEGALVKHVTQFLMELGAGFAFVGRQVHLEVSAIPVGDICYPFSTSSPRPPPRPSACKATPYACPLIPVRTMDFCFAAVLSGSDSASYESITTHPHRKSRPRQRLRACVVSGGDGHAGISPPPH